MTEFLEFARDLARRAGSVVLEGYSRHLHVEHKGSIDLLTEYDRMSEKLILESIREQYPSHSVLAEESGRHMEASGYLWIVDPLDGTTNYVHRYPYFAVSIALQLDKEIAVGVVYDPVRDELFSAESGSGAFLNDAQMHVSSVKRLEDAMLATGFAYTAETDPTINMENFFEFHKRVHGIRRAGSSALDCVWVAAGRLDGYWEFGIKPWDMAAGSLIVTEAGGQVSSFDGGESIVDRRSIVASNGHLHPLMMELLKKPVAMK